MRDDVSTTFNKQKVYYYFNSVLLSLCSFVKEDFHVHGRSKHSWSKQLWAASMFILTCVSTIFYLPPSQQQIEISHTNVIGMALYERENAERYASFDSMTFGHKTLLLTTQKPP